MLMFAHEFQANEKWLEQLDATFVASKGSYLKVFLNGNFAHARHNRTWHGT